MSTTRPTLIAGDNPSTKPRRTLSLIACLASLIGLTIYIEAFVIDSGALNGVFHQPPYLAIQFV